MNKFPGSSEIRTMTESGLEELAFRLRGEILSAVSRNGGHLASNLGIVELTLALHAEFNIPEEDALYFDVGHQCYVHKLLTGRQDGFQHLRSGAGCSGFPVPDESAADPVYAGHAGVAVSQALGDAQARLMQCRPGKAVAVIGDGSMCCGIPWEAMNNIRSGGQRMVMVINDNQMSISPATGSLRRCLNRIITARFYNRLRRALRDKTAPEGRLHRWLNRMDDAVKGLLLPKGILFQELGMRYFGPVDGHNIRELRRVLRAAREDCSPGGVLVHVVTCKGKGYEPAENEPSRFHGTAPFDVVTGKSPATSGGSATYSSVFGAALCRLAEKHPEVTAITAAMTEGTGLAEFASRFPARIFDTGIAEAHAVAYASGLARRGLRPVVALYSTFLQRALDNVYHDVCLNRLPVIFAVDRAGAVADGPTHHGIYDLGFLQAMPGLEILAPSDAAELEAMLEYACSRNNPVMLRYPRGKCPAAENAPAVHTGKARMVKEPEEPRLLIWGVGAECRTAVETAEILALDGIVAAVADTRFIMPADAEAARRYAHLPQVVIEDHCTAGGFADILERTLAETPHRGIIRCGWPAGEVIPHGSVDALRRKYELTPAQIAARIRNIL
ncbi:MAG: 1-deoxy-D-xylulose-5-phosphate synthase [Victivallales bacterium]|nr:1-deoxy-D-xylulose-5-phosphate synthase [Victivallales bacterium]